MQLIEKLSIYAIRINHLCFKRKSTYFTVTGTLFLVEH